MRRHTQEQRPQSYIQRKSTCLHTVLNVFMSFKCVRLHRVWICFFKICGFCFFFFFVLRPSAVTLIKSMLLFYLSSWWTACLCWNSPQMPVRERSPIRTPMDVSSILRTRLSTSPRFPIFMLGHCYWSESAAVILFFSLRTLFVDVLSFSCVCIGLVNCLYRWGALCQPWYCPQCALSLVSALLLAGCQDRRHDGELKQSFNPQLAISHQF